MPPKFKPKAEPDLYEKEKKRLSNRPSKVLVVKYKEPKTFYNNKRVVEGDLKTEEKLIESKLPSLNKANLTIGKMSRDNLNKNEDHLKQTHDMYIDLYHASNKLSQLALQGAQNTSSALKAIETKRGGKSFPIKN